MSRELFRLLTTGYGLAALGGAALWLAGAGALAAGLTFWIGGAAAVLAIAAMMTRRGGGASAATGDGVVRDEELMRWEQERRLDETALDETALDGSAADAARRIG